MPGKKVSTKKSRTGWSPLLLEIGGRLSVVILWKNFNGVVGMKKVDNTKNTLFGYIIDCTYSDGKFHIKDEMGQTVSLPNKLLDVSLIGGGVSPFGVELLNLRTQGELGAVAELLVSLTSQDSPKPLIHGFLQEILTRAKVCRNLLSLFLAGHEVFHYKISVSKPPTMYSQSKLCTLDLVNLKPVFIS